MPVAPAVTSGKAVCTPAAAVVPGDCHETAMFQKPCALSGQAALQLSGILAVLCQSQGVIHCHRKNISRELEKKGQPVQFSVI